VLALLALQRGKPVSADRLIDALWGDRQVANPVNALQAQIGHLRRTLGATAIVTSEAGHALDIGPDDVDAARFEQLVAKGRRLLEAGQRREAGQDGRYNRSYRPVRGLSGPSVARSASVRGPHGPRNPAPTDA
jgi:DNA-binding SARP family transcriptional activator